jgi:hypothetical protein
MRFIVNLGPGYPDLLGHIRIGFPSESGLSLLDEHFGIMRESICQCATERIAHLFSSFDSRIISDFPRIVREFEESDFRFYRVSKKSFGSCKTRRPPV